MSNKVLRMSVLISGNGSNLQAIIDAIESGKLKNAKIVQVLSDNASAYGLERARKYDIPTKIITAHDYADGRDRNRAYVEAIEMEPTDLIVLAGFLSIIPKPAVKLHEGRIINIHPSLLPKYGGKGCYGIKVHEQVLEAGETMTGATVHYVSTEIDAGEIILQKKVEVRPEDTPQILQQRVMEIEHEILPKAIEMIQKERGFI
ncbi:MAG: phosphoribosylglycinamide formyltransferase [Anaerovoracaceae bacterium]